MNEGDSYRCRDRQLCISHTYPINTQFQHRSRAAWTMIHEYESQLLNYNIYLRLRSIIITASLDPTVSTNLDIIHNDVSSSRIPYKMHNRVTSYIRRRFVSICASYDEWYLFVAMLIYQRSGEPTSSPNDSYHIWIEFLFNKCCKMICSSS